MGTKPARPNTQNYTPSTWERAIAVGAAGVVVILVAYLVIRNQQFADPSLVVFVRILLSFATALFGATIPGPMNVTWKGKGFAIRATSALGLFVLTYFFTPTVLSPHPQPQPQLDNKPAPPPGKTIGMSFDDDALGIHVSPYDRAEFSPYKIYYGSFTNKEGNEDIDTTPTREMKEQAQKTAQWIADYGNSVKCVFLYAGIDHRWSEENALGAADRLGNGVKQLLIADGINRDYIVAISYGNSKANPLFYADTDAKLTHNFNNYVSIAVVFK